MPISHAKCPLCNVDFYTLKAFVDHFEKHKKDPDYAGTYTTPNSTVTWVAPCYCIVCGEAFPTWDELLLHYGLKHKGSPGPLSLNDPSVEELRRVWVQSVTNIHSQSLDWLMKTADEVVYNYKLRCQKGGNLAR